jgi:hypothetical protein
MQIKIMMIINLLEEALNKIKKEGEFNLIYVFIYYYIYFNII